MNRIHFLTQTLEHIDGNLTASLSPATLAQTFGYSRSYLNRLFAETFGQSLGHYIRHRRLAHAQRKLMTTPKPILDIALDHHFDMLVLLLGYAHPRVRRLEQELPDAITKQLGV
jgi:AraC family transcriptional activator of mar-sox-rob regulon